LGELNHEKMNLQRTNQMHSEAQMKADAARVEYQEKKVKFEERLKSQQEFIERNNIYLNAGKKMKSFIDRFQASSRKKETNKSLWEELRTYLMVEKTKIEEAKRKQELMNQPVKKQSKKPTKRQIPEKDPYQRDKIVVGSTVKMIETKQSGTVEEIKGHLLTVTFGFMRLKIEREKLMWIR
jgi:DNA mismatch repair protein MutS2